MATISSLSSVQTSVSSAASQLRLQQATRDAEQAEQNARSLAADARQAWRVANDAQQSARSISAKADQAQTNATQARMGVTAIKTGTQVQVQLVGATGSTAEVAKATEAGPPAPSTASPVVNTQGQLTGRVVNTTA
jgi:hypothetical protein